MSLSTVVIPGDGTTDTFTVSFALGWLERTDITAWVEGEFDGGGGKVFRTITFLTDTLLKISGAPAGAGVNVIFTRTVTDQHLIVDYEDGDIMNEENLNTAQKQALMLIHQVLDGRFTAFAQDVSAGGFSLTNLRDPIANQDAATKKYVDDRIVTGGDAAAAAAQSAAEALVSKNQTVAVAATVSSDAADTHADMLAAAQSAADAAAVVVDVDADIAALTAQVNDLDTDLTTVSTALGTLTTNVGNTATDFVAVYSAALA